VSFVIRYSYLLAFYFFLIFEHSFAQTKFHGGVKFSVNDSIADKYKTEMFYITFSTKGRKKTKTSFVSSLDSKRFFPLSQGTYFIRIESTNFSTIKYASVPIKDKKITFLELPLVNKSTRKRSIRIKYHEPKRYKNCG